MKKKILITLLCFVILLLLLFGAGAIFYFTQKISHNADLIADVKSDIIIKRNNNGIPQIEANSVDDIYFSLGFLHAQDRLILMDYYRAIANGSISRIIGYKGQTLEKIAKTIGFKRRAYELEEKLSKPYHGYLEAYVKGINFAMEQGFHDTVIEKNWEPADVISILLLKEWSNAFLNNKENIFQLPVDQNRRVLNDIFPKDMLFFYKDGEESSVEYISRIKEILQEYVGVFNKGFAFYISSRNTKSSEPITGFSFDSTISVYPGLYPVNINYNNSKITGITFTGLPFIFTGKNQNISFSGFSLNVDTQDFYIERVKKIKDTLYYLSRAGWKKFKAAREPVSLDDNLQGYEIILETENGPVLNNIFDDGEYKSNITTIKSIFPKEDYVSALFDIPFSDNIYKAKNIVKNVYSLPRVYLFSSKNYSVKAYSGKVPIRNISNYVFYNGAYSSWNGVRDLSVYNYTTYFNDIAGSSFPGNLPYIIRENSLINNNRYIRLKNLVDNSSEITEPDVINILKDKFSLYAEQFTPIFLSVLENNPVTSARLTRIYFHDWKYNIDINSVAPSIFQILLQNFIYETYSDELGKNIEKVIMNYHLLIEKFYTLINNNRSSLFDDTNTDDIENRETIFDRAFMKSMRFLNRKKGPIMDDWEWGNLHSAHFHIPIKESSFVSKILYKTETQGFDGGISTVYAGGCTKNLIPVYSTSISGLFSIGISRIYMNFAYSINPMSEFYYKEKRKIDFINFENLNSKYLTRIVPSKK